MIIGFQITGHINDSQKSELFNYLVKDCFVQSDIARNIVNVGEGVYVYSKNVTETNIANKKFPFSLINVDDNRLVVVSLLSQKLELKYRGRLISIPPTGYYEIEQEDISYFDLAVEEGLVYIMDNTYKNESRNGINRSWKDADTWKD